MAHTIKNTSTGTRGFYNAGGALVELRPGETAENVDISDAELRSAKRTGWFEIDGDERTEGTAGNGDVTNADLAAADGRELDRIAEAEEIDLSGVKGTGANGRVLLDDKRRAIADARAKKASGTELDDMPDDDLRTTVQAITGKSAAEVADLDRDALLRLARDEEG